MSDVRYSYLHGPRRHVTIARSIDLEKNLVRCGISVCHPADVFHKALGREIAKGRLEAGKNETALMSPKAVNRLSWTICMPPDTKPLEVIMRYMAHAENWLSICTDVIATPVPTCVRELAREWRERKQYAKLISKRL